MVHVGTGETVLSDSVSDSLFVSSLVLWMCVYSFTYEFVSKCQTGLMSKSKQGFKGTLGLCECVRFDGLEPR